MKCFRLIGPITGISGDFADLDAVAVDVRNRGVIGNADQYPSLQHAFQLFPASLQCLAGKSWKACWRDGYWSALPITPRFRTSTATASRSAKSPEMPVIGPIKRKDFIACLRALGFEPPVSGGDHQDRKGKAPDTKSSRGGH